MHNGKTLRIKWVTNGRRLRDTLKRRVPHKEQEEETEKIKKKKSRSEKQCFKGSLREMLARLVSPDVFRCHGLL